MQDKLVITARWDDEADVWFVAESDVPGLATEAATIDALMAKLKVMVPELLELNGALPMSHGVVPFVLAAEAAGLARAS